MQHSSPIYYLAVIFIAVLIAQSEAKRKYDMSKFISILFRCISYCFRMRIRVRIQIQMKCICLNEHTF